MEEPLVCPSCAAAFASDERFCPRCNVPLVHADARLGPLTPAQEAARKVRPQYAEGELVRVATARHLVEAEFLQGLLLEEGIPSTLRRSMGFDVPDFIASGPRDVLVPRSGASAARDVLLQAEVVGEEPPAGPSPGRVLIGLLIATALFVLVIWAVTQLGG